MFGLMGFTLLYSLVCPHHTFTNYTTQKYIFNYLFEKLVNSPIPLTNERTDFGLAYYKISPDAPSYYPSNLAVQKLINGDVYDSTPFNRPPIELTNWRIENGRLIRTIGGEDAVIGFFYPKGLYAPNGQIIGRRIK